MTKKEEIFGHIKDKPGILFVELQDAVDWSRSSLKEVLRYLRDAGHIFSREVTRDSETHVRYFPHEMDRGQYPGPPTGRDAKVAWWG